jgi:hypothetical protein
MQTTHPQTITEHLAEWPEEGRLDCFPLFGDYGWQRMVYPGSTLVQGYAEAAILAESLAQFIGETR